MGKKNEGDLCVLFSVLFSLSSRLNLSPLTLSTVFVEFLAKPQLPRCIQVLGCQRSSFRFRPVRLRTTCGLIGSNLLVRFSSGRRAAVRAGRRGGGGPGGARTIPDRVSRRRQRRWRHRVGPLPFSAPPLLPLPQLWFPRSPRPAARRRKALGEGLWSASTVSRAKRESPGSRRR